MISSQALSASLPGQAAVGLQLLVLNGGSSSYKFGRYCLRAGQIETLLSETIDTPEPAPALAAIGRRLAASGLPPPAAIGHRVVHGGPGLREPCLIDAAVLRQLQLASGFAPLHLPATLAAIALARQQFPGLPQIACFDTGFHAQLPAVARRLPIARELHALGLQRYGFHGLSCASIVRQLGADLPPRLVIAHLGHGASVTAVLHGVSIDTSMGLTPSGGVMMATRSGDLDPGLLLYLLREKNFDVAQLEELVNQRSGLLGVSGLSSDLRQLHPVTASNPEAALAIAMFCYALRKQIAAMIAALEGIDLLVFTGGIGEHDAAVRNTICEGLRCFGLHQNAARVRVLAAQEELQIALETGALLRPVAT